MRLFLKISLLILMIGNLRPVHAQLNAERTAWNRLQAQKWDRSFRLLQKSLRKDSTGVEANYVLAQWYLATGNPDFQIDSAHRYIKTSQNRYALLTLRERERVQRFPIDSTILHAFHLQVDSAAFEQVKKYNSEAAYTKFITDYPNANQLSNALELRDEVSFLDALKTNTYQSFFEYLQKYPKSNRAEEAKERYEKLLFEEKTKDKKLASYVAFLSDYPASPFTRMAHQQVFEITTATGEPDDFLTYIKRYPSSPYNKFARDLLFHVYDELDEKIPTLLLTDSVRSVMALNASFWIPFYKNGLYGFMNQTGEEVIPPTFSIIKEEYKCGPVRVDILHTGSGLFSRSGKKISDSQEMRALGFGFLEIGKQNCLQLIHKSGRIILSGCYDGFKLVGAHFLAARKGALWQLFTLSGRLLSDQVYVTIEEIEGVIVSAQYAKKSLHTVEQLAALADGESIREEWVFDEVRAVGKGLLLVRNGGLEGIVTNKMKFVVPLDRHVLTQTPFGLIVKRNDQYTVRGLSVELEKDRWDRVTYQGEWLVMDRGGSGNLFHLPSKKMVDTEVDSVWFDRGVAFVTKESISKVYLSGSRVISLPADSPIRFVNSRDSVQFFFTENKNKRTLYSIETGEQLFTTDYEISESLGSDFFLVSKGARKGVLSRKGRELVPVEMDVIVLNQERTLSLLKDKKFGLFDLNSSKLIKPIYERNITKLDEKHLVAYTAGKYGLIGWDTKPVTAFEYLEIKPWRDSVVWVRQNFQWLLINFFSHEVLLDKVRNFEWVRNTPDEKIVIVHRENYFGVLSSRTGLFIPATFSEILNLGTSEVPFYFTEKYVEEAGIFVVIYYDQHGKLVRRQAFEEDEYEHIFCEDQ